ncbi:MAG: PAS domain-containing sensor histidine kinase, partial [Bellilinea sp.]
ELFEDSIDPILLTGWDGRIQSANRQAARSLGREPDQLTGLSMLDLHVAPPERLGPDFAALKSGSTISYESNLHALDGTTSPVEVHIRQVQFGAETILQWFLRDIRERKQLDTLRDDLMAMIYHDLRSPLANIISSLDLLSTMLPAESDASIDAVFQIASRSTDRLQRLISSLLDIYRLESGQAIVRKEDVDCAHLVRDSVEVVKLLAESKNQTLTLTQVGDGPVIQGDFDMIRRVFINLLENAIKFTPNGGSIEAGLAEQAGSARFWVKDTGPGIPEESHEVIFERYSRLQTDRYPKGIGLGLAFCRLAVLAHGGKIWVESSVGAGSRFVFTLPAGA